MGLRYGTVITPQADLESWQRSLKRCFWFIIINERLCNMQLFPKIWILEISKKAFRISGSVSGCKLIILPDIQPAKRIVIISAAHSFLLIILGGYMLLFDQSTMRHTYCIWYVFSAFCDVIVVKYFWFMKNSLHW